MNHDKKNKKSLSNFSIQSYETRYSSSSPQALNNEDMGDAEKSPDVVLDPKNVADMIIKMTRTNDNNSSSDGVGFSSVASSGAINEENDRVQVMTNPIPEKPLPRVGTFRATAEYRTLLKKHEVKYYDIHPAKKGLVLFFYQTNNRSGWQKDLHNIKHVFGGKLRCELHEYKDLRGAEIKAEFESWNDKLGVGGGHKSSPYNYLIIIVAAHGGNDPDGGYFLDSRDEKVPYLAFEDFITMNVDMKAFIGKPRVLIWNVCRGPRTVPIVSMPPENNELERDFRFPTSLMHRGRPVNSDYAIVYSCGSNAESYRLRTEGSFLIQMLTDLIEAFPCLDLESMIKKINLELSPRVLRMDSDGVVGLQIPTSLCFQYAFRFTNPNQ